MAVPGGSPEVDIMNDPAYDANVALHDDGASDNNEPDYCRVCRSEGSEDQPLYHPCKCSGSIKFVHEECLLEWLQHSQKKYCELCKTPFQFTKVYDPDMPTRIPTPLFLQRLAHHLLQNTILWARAALVATVWLGWLPFMVRWMWRGWFWVSDGGWWLLHASARAATASVVAQAQAGQTSSTTSPTASTSPSGRGILGFLSSPALSARMSPVNGGPAIANATGLTNQTLVAYYPDGIFFDTNPFSDLTSSPYINRAIVDILEGQLLTALIVISFILVFLIREWVVQQQPALAGGEDAQAAPVPDAPEAENPPVDAAAEEVDRAQIGNVWEQQQQADHADLNAEARPAERPARVIAQPRRRRAFPRPQQENDVVQREPSENVDTGDAQTPQEGTSSTESSTTFNFNDRIQRPQPTRENTAQVTNVRRDMEESGTVGTPGTGSFNFNTRPEDFRFGNSSSSLPMFGGDRQTPDTSRRASNIWNRGTMDIDEVDMGRSEEWRRSMDISNLASTRSTPGSRGSGAGSHIFDDAEEVNKTDAEWSTSNLNNGNNFWGTSGRFDKIFGEDSKDKESDNATTNDVERREIDSSDSKGKDKEELPYEGESAGSSGQAGLDVWKYRQRNTDADSETDSESGKSETSRGAGPSEWSTAAQAGDPPTRTDTPAVTQPNPTPNEERAEEHIENAAAEPRQAQDVQQDEIDRILRVARERGLPEANVRNALDRWAANAGGRRARMPHMEDVPAEPPNAPNAPNPPANPAAVAPPRRGFLDWFIGPGDGEDNGGEQPAAGEEGDALAPAQAALLDEEQQAIIDEDAADDFEGIMELVGMRGPLVGLITNAGICIVLITATVAVGVAFPYVTGKTVMMILAHPIVFFFNLPMLALSFVAEFIVDSTTAIAFSLLLWMNQAVKLFLTPFSFVPGLSVLTRNTIVTDFLRTWAMDGRTRVFEKFISLESTYMNIRKYPSSAVPPLSLVARESWTNITTWFAWLSDKLGLEKLLGGPVAAVAEKAEARGVSLSKPMSLITSTLEKAFNSPVLPVNGTSIPTIAVGIVDSPSQQLATPYALYRWSAWDRAGVVLLGYAFFTVCGAIYLRTRRRAPTGSVERLVIDFLEQCGGVMKVVLIIGIEMVVFPLYCGILLDAAMLPLFEDASIISRIRFTASFPLTSMFVHWFVGTCYMFHFALFVSMCRRIMRSGVLYFIRDPDDPTFHPVRDVLDRPVITQLRKIAFSGLIYGILVVVCLGGVVWGLSVAFKNVLPIHWSSNEPVLEFPVDLLFYNFLMPVAVKFFRPSDGLQRMYEWWFRKCARWLRLSSFMFGERNHDEEGYYYRRTWTAWLFREKARMPEPVADETATEKTEEQTEEVSGNSSHQANVPNNAEFKRDGRFVRAPASDSVRRPKGQTVFIPVDENNQRIDGEEDPEDSAFGPHSNEYKMVYVPSWFRFRIGIVVISIWLFAAFTGVGVTIMPLILGRAILQAMIPKEVRLNDIYAFSVGIYIMGGVAYAVAKWPVVKAYCGSLFTHTNQDEQVPSKWTAVKDWTIRAAKVSYVFTSFAIVLPTLVALMIEFYLIIPIHTYFSPEDEKHVIHFIQDWTLGVIYVKMMGRMLLLDRDSPWARALRGVVARGYLDPDVKLATNTFIAPAASFMLAALLVPLCVGYIAVKLFLYNASSATISQAYRYSYPAVFMVAVTVVTGYGCHLLVERWRSSVKDEIYLRGERLHNHGEDRPPPTPPPRREISEEEQPNTMEPEMLPTEAIQTDTAVATGPAEE